MHLGPIGRILGAICASGLSFSVVEAQAPNAPTGFLLGLGPSVSVDSYGGLANYILEGGSSGATVGGWLRIGYATRRVVLSVGTDITTKRRTAKSLVLPLDIEWRPGIRLGPVCPSLLAGVGRYAVTSRVSDIDFAGSGFRLGASFTMPISDRAFVVSRPIVEFFHLDPVSISTARGDTGLPNARWSQRYGLWIGIWLRL